MRFMMLGVCAMLLLGACAIGRPQPSPTPTPDVWIEYHIEGGVAGFCDDLTIRSDGTVRVESCRLDAPRTFTLRDDQMRQLAGWIGRFATTTHEHRDPPNVADGMYVRLVFHGQGRTPPDGATLETLRVLAGVFIAQAHAFDE
nr:hypothetical protein [Ardenticatena sp.]